MYVGVGICSIGMGVGIWGIGVGVGIWGVGVGIGIWDVGVGVGMWGVDMSMGVGYGCRCRYMGVWVCGRGVCMWVGMDNRTTTLQCSRLCAYHCSTCLTEWFTSLRTILCSPMLVSTSHINS